MSVQSPDVETTLAIIFGASEWPNHPEFRASPSFKNSAEDIREYLLSDDGFGLSATNLCDLFDVNKPSYKILREMHDFLADRMKLMRGERKPARDLLVYYVGHGGFANPSNDFFLAVRSTQEPDTYLSSIPIQSLAKTLRSTSRQLRRYLILDSCFSAAAHQSFQASGPAEVALVKAADAFPMAGTALLCSSGARDPAKAPPGERHTMFSGALLDVLSGGADDAPPRLSLNDLKDLVWDRLRDRFQDEAVRPEVHVPEQREGMLNQVPLFPNIKKRFERPVSPDPAPVEVHALQPTPHQTAPSVLYSHLQPEGKQPVPPPPPRSEFERRITQAVYTTILGIAIAGIVAVAIFLMKDWMPAPSSFRGPREEGLYVRQSLPAGTKLVPQLLEEVSTPLKPDFKRPYRFSDVSHVTTNCLGRAVSPSQRLEWGDLGTCKK